MLEATKALVCSPQSSPLDIFLTFKNSCMEAYHEEIVRNCSELDRIAYALPPLTRPKATSPVIQADGYKQWIPMEQEKYDAAMAVCIARDIERRTAQAEFWKEFNRLVIDYCSFLQKSRLFEKGEIGLFTSSEDIYDFIGYDIPDFQSHFPFRGYLESVDVFHFLCESLDFHGASIK